ncbi:hypothetical protein [Microcoleus sp. N3A4]|uniref:hypothetical protein n=1 Tax=Microcoleus sp. N3A4 TaxID=3055379 RepID=UPI002FD7103B
MIVPSISGIGRSIAQYQKQSKSINAYNRGADSRSTPNYPCLLVADSQTSCGNVTIPTEKECGR